MVETETHEARFSSFENDALPEYRQLSRFAILSLVLAILSVSALVHPLLWVFPVVTVVLSLFALRHLADSSEVAGRPLAYAALLIAILFGTLAVSWTMARRYVLYAQAREHAEQWLDLLRAGEYLEAHQLTEPPFRRPEPGGSLAEHYAEQPPVSADEMTEERERMQMMQGNPHADLQTFLQSVPMNTIVELDGEFRYEFAGNVRLLRGGARDTYVEQLYDIFYDRDGQPAELEFALRMKRTVDQGKASWQVDTYGEQQTTR